MTAKSKRKPWGITTCIHADERTEIHRIDVRPGGKSSVHRHEHKHNTFTVISGTICIRTWPPTVGVPISYNLISGQTLTIPADLDHQFEAVGPCSVYEVYVSADPLRDIDPEDIVRQNNSQT